MKRTALVLAALTLSACAGPAAQATPTPRPTAAATPARTMLVAELRASNEVPPVTSSEAACTGRATVTLDTSGASPSATFDITVTGCSTSVIGAHIHEGAAGVNGAVRVSTGISAQQPEAVQASGTTIRKSGIAVEAAMAQQIISNPAAWYFNMHSPMHTGGFIRGQMTRQ